MRILFLQFFILLLCKGLFSQQADSLILSHWDNGVSREIKIIRSDSSYRMLKFFSSGKLQCEIHHNKAGQLNGTEKCYFENGTVKQETHWKNGINYGKFFINYPSGQKTFEGSYLEDGSPHGLWKGWYQNGQIQYEQSFSHGMKHGKWANYRKDGSLELLQYFENGLLIKEEK